MYRSGPRSARRIRAQPDTGAGLSYGIGRLGNAVGPLIVAFLYSTYGYRSVFAYIAVCWVMVAVLITAFGPRMNARTLA